MKILFISHLMADLSQGPNWSIPASIKAQSSIDDVYWVDMGNTVMDHWKAVKAYHNISELRKLQLDKLPVSFQNPDIVVINGFYRMSFVNFAKELRKKGIPYIIVPRCSLTYEAQQTKKIKKFVANKIFFERYTREALCIQYLSPEERDHSSIRWNKNSIVVPNGVDMPTLVKSDFSSDRINAIFIGRIVADHKGLDLLFAACNSVRNELESANFHLTLYGEKIRDYEKLYKYVCDHHLDNIISFGGLIAGEEKKAGILNADLHIMTSRFEGLPMALIETLAYGLPALVTPGTNMLNEIKENNAGWWCECDVKSISDALLRIIKEKHELKVKGERAWKLARKYSWEDIAKDFHIKIQSVLNRN